MAQALPENSSDSEFSEDDFTGVHGAFNIAVEFVNKNASAISNDKLLELYGLYKQSLCGKCDTDKPSWWDGKGRKKWDAWRKLGDMSQDEAKSKYVEIVDKYRTQTSNTETSKKATWVTVSSLQRSSEPTLFTHEMTLIDAARENCAARVRELLAENPQLKYEADNCGLTALHWAADRDSTDALKALIEAGSVIDAVDEFGQTSLHYAATVGNIESLIILVQEGATLTKDENGFTPLDVAFNDEIRNILETVAKPD